MSRCTLAGMEGTESHDRGVQNEVIEEEPQELKTL